MKRHKVFSVFGYSIMCTLFSVCSLSYYFNLQTPTYKSYQALKNRNIDEALRYLNQARIKHPFKRNVYFNLGFIYDFKKEPRKALENYRIILDEFLPRHSTFFYAVFNKAELHARLGEIEQALKFYQMALDLGQKEIIIKKNIELLLKDAQNQNGNSSQKDKNSQNQESKQDQNSKQRESKENSQKESNKDSDQKEQQDKAQADSKDQASNEDQANSEDQADSKDQANSEDQADSKDQANSEDQANSSKENQSLSNQGSSNKNQTEDLKDLDESAILEEVQKQENKVRAQFYKGKSGFGDKTDKDW